jgi:predicted enzyme related to lactoylglutathione lyase
VSNHLCHFEIMTRDPEKARAFYGSLFDWTFDDRTMPGYTLIHAGADPTGGLFKSPPEANGSCLNVYIQVRDIDATLKKVRELGGRVLVEKTAIPNTGHFAMFIDPEGITIGIMQPNHG